MMKLDDDYVLRDVAAQCRVANVDATDIRVKARAIRRAVAPDANLLEELRSPATNFNSSATLRLPLPDPGPQFICRGYAQATEEWETVVRVLENSNEAERVALRIEYRALYDRNIEGDLTLLNTLS